MNSSPANNLGNKIIGKNLLSSSDDIKAIAKMFPYSLPIQALLSKSLKESNKLDFDKFLKISSVLSPDRTWLYNYINDTSQKPINITKQTEFQEFNNSNVDLGLDSISLINTEIIDIHKINEIKGDKTFTSFNNKVTINEDSKSVDNIDENMVSEALDQVNVSPIQASQKTSIISLPIDIGLVKSTEMNTSGNSFLNNTLEKEIMKVAIDKTIQKEVDEIIASGLESKNRVENESIEPVPEGFNFWLNPSKNKVQSREEKLKKIDALIEKFIKSEPRIVAKKVEFYSPVNVAKHSVEFNEDLVSEPLAAIFEKQGYFDKAIRAYEKLSLKFPEKRTYFATRIEKIKEIIKNIKNTK